MECKKNIKFNSIIIIFLKKGFNFKAKFYHKSQSVFRMQLHHTNLQLQTSLTPLLILSTNFLYLLSLIYCSLSLQSLVLWFQNYFIPFLFYWFKYHFGILTSNLLVEGTCWLPLSYACFDWYTWDLFNFDLWLSNVRF